MTLNRLAVWVRSVALLLAIVGDVPAQSAYPLATHPKAVAPDPNRPSPALVVYAHGLLTLQADNTSLNQLLLQITRATGMRLVGSSREERVFGSFGPDIPAKILATLLQGTGTNMMIAKGSSPGPAELILTPQNGPATPSSSQSSEAVQSSAQPPAPLSRAPGQPAEGPQGNDKTTSDSSDQAQQRAPLTSAERALLINRLQQQQGQANASAQPR